MDGHVDDDKGPALTLRLELESGEPLAGTIGVEGRAERVRFHGWIDFMAAIAALQSPGGG